MLSLSCGCCRNLRWKFWSLCPAAGVNFPGGTPLQEANGDVLLDGVAFSKELLE